MLDFPVFGFPMNKFILFALNSKSLIDLKFFIEMFFIICCKYKLNL